MRVRIVTPALLSLAWLASAAGTAEPASGSATGADEHAGFAAGVEALRTGDWQTAAREFSREAGRASVLSEYARFFLAETLSRLGDLAGARQAAEAIVAGESDSPVVPLALHLAARLSSREGDEAGAERLLRQFLSRFPQSQDSARVRYLLALTLEAQGRLNEAAATFRELWLLAPAAAYGEAAGDHLARLADAGTLLPPPTSEERLERVERLLAGGALAEARDEGELLLAERPGRELAFRALRVVSDSLYRLGRDVEAARAVERALALAPPHRRPALLLELGRLQYRAGAGDLALASLDRLIREFPREPESARALVLKGRILEEAGRVADAVSVYQRAAVEFPNFYAGATALWRLGWIAYFRNDAAGAGKQFERLMELSGGGAYRLAAAYWAGRSRETLGQHGEAQRLFRIILAEAPRSYYGILAARRAGTTGETPGTLPPITLPADPLAPLVADPPFAKAEALRAVGLIHYAEAELEELLAGAVADPLKLYGLSALWVRDEQYHLALRILRRYFVDLAWSGHAGLPGQFWEMFYPMSWRRELRQAAEQAGLDIHLVAAVVREESSFFPRARSRAGARGLMQLMPQTARLLARQRGMAFGDGEWLDEPGPNLELGAEFLAELLREFGDPRLALAAYNAGPTRVREWWGARRSEDLETFVEQIPFGQTRRFVKRVLISWHEYRRIYGAGR